MTQAETKRGYFKPGDSVRMNAKADKVYAYERTRTHVWNGSHTKSVPLPKKIEGMTGEVLSVAFQNKRKSKQWVVVKLFNRHGHPLGEFRLPRNWLERV